MAPLRAYGGIRAALREFGPVQLADAGLREVWVRIGLRLLRLLRLRITREYGWCEALFFPIPDYWLRYAGVINSLEMFCHDKPFRLLEVSSGRGGIASFLGLPDAQVCLVDQTVDILAARHSTSAWRVCADGCVLPFADRSFDIVVSVDTVEHIPQPRRAAFLEELKRIARWGVIITCPLVSEDGRFQARKTDLCLQEELRERNRKVPRWLEEHIDRGHPSVEELLGSLEGAVVKGSQNCESWLRFARFYLRPFVWFFAGFFYLLALKKHDALPPHWRGLMIWQKNGLVRQDETARVERPDDLSFGIVPRQ
jgi:SAM-dependent methyltransferase